MSLKHSQGSDLPNTRGTLSHHVPTAAIVAANAEVRQTMEAAASSGRRTRGPYNVYSPEERAMMGKYTAENGVMSAKRFNIMLQGPPQ